MQQKSFKKNLVWLRVCITFFLLAILSLFLFSFTMTYKLGDDVWKQLGLSQTQGTEKIRNSFINNYFDAYGIRNAKNIAVGNRAAVAKDLLAFAKQYVNSTAFKSAYEKERASAKPVAPTVSTRTKEDIRKEKIEEVKKQMKDTEDYLKTASGDMKKTMQEILEMHKASLKDYQDPNSQMIELFWQGEQFSRNGDQKQYDENLKRWEKDYPADFKEVIKIRLKHYLDVANTVDFSAELVEKYGKKRFVNPKYEGKNYEWKMIFRAGKEVYDVTKPTAEQWLKEL